MILPPFFKENKMKVKMLAGLALSTLLAASLSFAGPETMPIDDMNATTDGMQSPADGLQNPDTQSQNQNNLMTSPGTAAPDTTVPSSDSNNNANSSNMNDDMSADTATGDDDY